MRVQLNNKILVDSVKRLLRLGAVTHLKNIVNRSHAADLSVALRKLSPPERYRLFGMIKDAERKGDLFSELDEDIFLELIENIKTEAIAVIFESMSADDVADLLGKLPEEKADAILKIMKKEVEVRNFPPK